MKIDEAPKEMVAPDTDDVSDNFDNDGIDEAVEGKLDNDEEIVGDNDDEERNEELTAQKKIKPISLHDAKNAAVDLYNFYYVTQTKELQKMSNARHTK